jgi:hypothetical protein
MKRENGRLFIGEGWQVKVNNREEGPNFSPENVTFKEVILRIKRVQTRLEV